MKEEIQIAEFIKNVMPQDIPKIIVDIETNEEAIFSKVFIEDG